MKTEPDHAAMPFEFIKVDQSGNPMEQHYAFGLTKREHFAALAMQGMISNPNGGGWEGESLNQTIQCAINSADALISALNEGKEK